MKNSGILFAAFILSFSYVASADSTVCSNADQSFRYSHVRSNGGAYRDRVSVTFKGQSASRNNFTGNSVHVNLENGVTVDPPKNGSSHTVYTAKATGSFQTAGGPVSFSEWVLCEEEIFAQCHLCP